MGDPMDWYEETIDRLSEEKEQLHAEIERLKKEVAEAREESASYHDAYEGEKIGRAIDRDTAWNDAIEAAAKTHEESGCCHAARYATAIRAMKRSQP